MGGPLIIMVHARSVRSQLRLWRIIEVEVLNNIINTNGRPPSDFIADPHVTHSASRRQFVPETASVRCAPSRPG